MTSPRFLLAVCQNMRWTNGGVFATEAEARREQRIVAKWRGRPTRGF